MDGCRAQFGGMKHTNDNMMKIGIDIGRVIIGPVVNGREDTSFLGKRLEDALDTPPAEGAIEGVAELVERSRGQAWLISKCGPGVQAKTRAWLERQQFWRKTGMPKEQIGIFQTVAAALAVVAVGMSQLIPRFMTRSSAGHKTSGVQIMPLRKFSTMKIVQWALLEGAALFIAGVFYMTRQQSMLMPLGILIALLTLMKSQPLAYNKDNQEDKEPLFDVIDTVKGSVRAFADMVPAIEPRRDNMREAARRGRRIDREAAADRRAGSRGAAAAAAVPQPISAVHVRRQRKR